MVTYTELFQQAREQLPSAALCGAGSSTQQNGMIVPETASFERHALDEQVRRGTIGLRKITLENPGQARGRALSQPLPIDHSKLKDISLSPPGVGERFEKVERPVEAEPETIEEEYDSDSDLSDSSDFGTETHDSEKSDLKGSDALVEERSSQTCGKKAKE